MAEEVPPADAKTAVRLNVTVRHETKSRLDEARNKRRVDVNVSQICDSAINSELDRLDKPGIADVIARLRLESDRRRGEPYREGFMEGQHWARKVGSWGEICWYARLTEDDVQLETLEWPEGNRTYLVLSFVGRFYAPEEDYGKNAPDWWGAPAVMTDEYEDGDPVFNRDPHYCDQRWRGWLAGVLDVHSAVLGDLEPIEPVAPTGAPSSPPVRDVDPDDIPF